MTLFEQILEVRGLTKTTLEPFLHPEYVSGHDPFLLPDMVKAVERLVLARERQERIMIYGDYDIDGLTATTVLVEALKAFGFRFIETFIPNRFVEGYGMTVDAVERIADKGAQLIITVDCGSLSDEPIRRANELGVDVIVTDHHNVAPIQPPAVAVINPKRLLQDNPTRYRNLLLTKHIKAKPLYPFLDLPGVGVAFKLVQALQTRLDGLSVGQEKWLLDLVALGTVCDVVTLVDENRMHVYWGLQVLAKTRRPGLRALMAVSGIESDKLSARSLGFGLGPRMNASGRLETAKYSQGLLLTASDEVALELAEQLDAMNAERRAVQDAIYHSAVQQAEQFRYDNVLVVSDESWNHGIVGIVAAKLLEKYKKPAFVLQELGKESKGSARSFGDFSAAGAIRAADDLITKGGGHHMAAGVTLPTANIDQFRRRVNEYYLSLELSPQQPLLLPKEDASTQDFTEITEQLVRDIQQLEPFGSGNPEPVIRVANTTVIGVRRMGNDGQHLKLTVRDTLGNQLSLIAFSADEHWFVEAGEQVTVWLQPIINEWRGLRSVEGRLVRLEIVED